MSFIEEDTSGYIHPRENHTVRLKHEKDKQDIILEVWKCAERLSKDAYLEPLSILEEYKHNIQYKVSVSCFDETQMSLYSETYLNNKNMWDIIDLLEENCVKKEKKRIDDTNYKDKYCVYYDLSIIGHKLVRHKKNKKLLDKFFHLNGKKYNIKFIYFEEGLNFCKYGVFKFNKTLNRIYGNVKVKCNDGEIRYNMVTPRRHGGIMYPTKPNSKKNYIEIDLNENTEITHIGTMGMVHNVRRFPNHPDFMSYKHDIHEISKHIKLDVVENIDKIWVTSYEVEVRVDSGRKWVKIGKFSGNNDRLTEVVHKLDDKLFVRYIRFIPITYSNSPSMQVSVFGPKESKIKDDDDDIITCKIIFPSCKNNRFNCYKMNYWGSVMERERKNKKRYIDSRLRNYTKKYNKNIDLCF